MAKFDFLLTSSKKLYWTKKIDLRVFSWNYFERVKEHIPSHVDKFLKPNDEKKEICKITNAVKRSTIAEHLEINQSYTESLNLVDIR